MLLGKAIISIEKNIIDQKSDQLERLIPGKTKTVYSLMVISELCKTINQDALKHLKQSMLNDIYTYPATPSRTANFERIELSFRPRKVQRVGNCVMQSWEVGQAIRAGNEQRLWGFYKWVKREEVSFAASFSKKIRVTRDMIEETPPPEAASTTPLLPPTPSLHQELRCRDPAIALASSSAFFPTERQSEAPLLSKNHAQKKRSCCNHCTIL